MKSSQIITVKDEYGKDVELEIIETLEVDNNKYAIVSPINSEEAYAYRTVEKDGEIEYISIGYGEEFEKVLEKFNSLIDED
jgi:uncharacterized protein YrzB (UPF0473 family)